MHNYDMNENTVKKSITYFICNGEVIASEYQLLYTVAIVYSTQAFHMYRITPKLATPLQD